MATIKRKSPVKLPVIQKPFYDLERDGVTQSMLGMMLSCPEKARLRIQEGLSPQKSTGALAFGDVFHRALDQVYSKSKVIRDQSGTVVTPFPGNYDPIIAETVDRLYKADKEKLKGGLAGIAEEQEFELTFGLARIMLEAYFRRWKTDFADLKWIDIERIFEVPYCLEIDRNTADTDQDYLLVPVRGKYDGTFDDIKGNLWLFETKTKGQIDNGAIADKLGFDLQTMLYLWSMIHVYGRIPHGVIYNLVRRPLLRMGVKETLPGFLERVRKDVIEREDFYFIRYTASISKDEIDEWVRKDLASIMDMARRWSNGEVSYRNSGNCMMWNRACEYLQACSIGDRSYLSKREEVFPELVSSGEEE